MLYESHVTDIAANTDEWRRARLGRFTSSEIHNLMGEKVWTQKALSYIYRKVGESITEDSTQKELSNEAVIWGNANEAEAIRKYGRTIGMEFKNTQRFICDPDSIFGCTPDFLIVESPTKDEKTGEPGYNVITGEVKCPFTYEAFIALSLLETPLDLKKNNPEYYWQVLDEMANCGTLRGLFIVYHPQFGSASLKVLEFKAMQVYDGKRVINDDLGLLKERKKLAVIKFNEVKNKLQPIEE